MVNKNKNEIIMVNKNKNEELDLIELFDSYCVLRDLEDNSSYFGNVNYVFSCLLGSDRNILKLFAYYYESIRV